MGKRLKETYPQETPDRLHHHAHRSRARERAYALRRRGDLLSLRLGVSAFARLLDAVKPALVIVLETEIWPNFLRESRHRNIPVIFASGRISDRSFARLPKISAASSVSTLRPFLASAFRNAAAFLMQTHADADRLHALGAPADRVKVSGNLKVRHDLARRNTTFCLARRKNASADSVGPSSSQVA